MRTEQSEEEGILDSKTLSTQNREMVADVGSRKAGNWDGDLVGTIFLCVHEDRTIGFNIMPERWEDQAWFLLAMRKNGS